jgi:hypothetical protein
MIRKFVVASSVVLIAVLLTGCNPPMPEALKVSLGERTIQCGDEFVELKVFAEMADIGEFWNSSMDSACAGSMGTVQIEDYPTGSGLVISEEEVTGCTPFATVPLAVDAAVFSFNFLDIYEVNLSPKLIAEILRGEVSQWDDARVAELNPGVEFPAMPINLIRVAPYGAIPAMEIWLSAALGEEVKLENFTPSIGSEVDALYEMLEGDLKLTSFGALQISGLNYANMKIDEADDTSIVLPDVLSIATGIAQTVPSGDAPFLSFVYDPTIQPAPLPGAFEVLNPWGALFPVNLSLCGEDRLQERYVARFFLRLDAQGSIQTGVFGQLNEDVRVKSVSVVDDGLPEVEISEELERELQG